MNRGSAIQPSRVASRVEPTENDHGGTIEIPRFRKIASTRTSDLRVTDNSIEVVLDVAGTKNEQDALAALCRTVNGWKLTHPGDVAGRPLRFRTNIS